MMASGPSKFLKDAWIHEGISMVHLRYEAIDDAVDPWL
jgi:hypothetical protein